MRKYILLTLCLLSVAMMQAQDAKQLYDSWQVLLERKDGKLVPFMLEKKMEQGKTVLYILNAREQIKITNVTITGDSMFFATPAFESSFRMRLLMNGDMNGTYIKGTSGTTQYWPLHAYAKTKNRFPTNSGPAKNNISGQWDVTITRANGTLRKALGVFEQNGNMRSGSF